MLGWFETVLHEKGLFTMGQLSHCKLLLCILAFKTNAMVNQWSRKIKNIGGAQTRQICMLTSKSGLHMSTQISSWVIIGWAPWPPLFLLK